MFLDDRSVKMPYVATSHQNAQQIENMTDWQTILNIISNDGETETTGTKNYYSSFSFAFSN